jgi:hypothetical protein
MRRSIVLVLLFAVLAGACEAPARAPVQATTRMPPDPRSLPRRALPPGWPAEVLPLPAGFPVEGMGIARAAGERAARTWIVDHGTVVRLLRDDTRRPRHQRFVVRVDAGITVLVAHNIDLAPRVPLRKGDTVALRGEYVWNDQGGVVHWTHRDRRDRNGGGWIVWKGQNFR